MMSGEDDGIEVELEEYESGGKGIEINFSVDDDVEEPEMEEVHSVEEVIAEECNKGALEKVWDQVTNPWSRLSKRVKTVIILVITAVILVGLVLAIFVPYLWTDSQTRSYFIQAEMIERWDYAPSGMNEVRGTAFNEAENVFMASSNVTVGRVYRKAHFVAYTNETFHDIVTRDEDAIHLGLMGPVVRAAVGEIIEITVRNDLDFPISFFASGLAMTKAAEGAAYADKYNGTKGDRILPGETYVYVIDLTELDGPASNDFSSVAYAYYSHVDTVAEFNSGLAGVIVVTESGKADEDAVPTDVDKEVFLVPATIDENLSVYLDDNVYEHLDMDEADIARHMSELKSDPHFMASNLMRSINGYMFGNLPGIKINAGKRSRWYIVGLGEGTHTLIWSGQTLVSESQRLSDVVSYEGTATVADLEPLEAGTWLIEAYGRDGQLGMQVLYEVV